MQVKIEIENFDGRTFSATATRPWLPNTSQPDYYKLGKKSLTAAEICPGHFVSIFVDLSADGMPKVLLQEWPYLPEYAPDYTFLRITKVMTKSNGNRHTEINEWRA